VSTFKKLDKNSVVSIPYEANKQYNLEYTKLTNVCQSGSDSDVKILTGQKISTDFVADFEPTTFSNQYQKSIYNTINRLYYNKFSSSFDYDSNTELIKNFPTSENSFIRVIEIPQSKYGNNIYPNNFQLVSDSYNINDDGNGNLFDNNYPIPVHIGNIFYNQGLAIITNQDYRCVFPIEPVVFTKQYKFATNESKVINLLSDSISYCGQTIVPSTVEIVNPSDNFIYTISNGILTFNQTIVGKHTAQFFVKDTLNVCSNIANIEINVQNNCDFNVVNISGSVSQSDCVSTIPDFELVKVPTQNCSNYFNGIDGYLIYANKLTTRLNGVSDYEYLFNSNKNVNWSISLDGGLSYFDVATVSNKLRFTTELNNALNYLKNSYFFILKLSDGESYTEYQFKINPLNGEYTFEKIKEYLDINLIDKNCLLNHYKVVTNHCDITSINWSFSEEMSGVVVSLDEIVLLGCRGIVTAQIISRCCPTVTKTLIFNGNCFEPTCSNSKIDLEIYATNVLNNYIIFANTNFYLKNYPNWKFFGNIKFLSNVDSNYLEIEIIPSDTNPKIVYETQDFCKNLYSEHYFNKFSETVLIPSSNTTVIAPPFFNREVVTADLNLSIFSNNIYPIKNEIVQLNILMQNKGYIDATNIVVKLDFDSNFLINDNSILKYNYQKYGSSYYFSIPSILIGEYNSIKFSGTILGEIGTNVIIKSEIFQVDQIDPNSTPGNGTDNSEDDTSSLKMLVKSVSNMTVSTTFSCKPIILNFPYTNYICSIYNDARGSIIIKAINPLTNTSDDIEYSFDGDIDVNYQSTHISNNLPNGLYEIFVRLKVNKLCKTSTKVRISCLNGQPSTEWILDGNICIN
jgi:hypothetical protein